MIKFFKSVILNKALFWALFLCVTPVLSNTQQSSWPTAKLFFQQENNHQKLILRSLVHHFEKKDYILSYRLATLYVENFPDTAESDTLKKELPHLKSKATKQEDAHRWRYEPGLDGIRQAYLLSLKGPPEQLFFQSGPNERDSLIVFIASNEYRCEDPCFIDISGKKFKATPLNEQPFSLKIEDGKAAWKHLTAFEEIVVTLPNLAPFQFRVLSYDELRFSPVDL